MQRQPAATAVVLPSSPVLCLVAWVHHQVRLLVALARTWRLLAVAVVVVGVTLASRLTAAVGATVATSAGELAGAGARSIALATRALVVTGAAAVCCSLLWAETVLALNLATAIGIPFPKHRGGFSPLSTNPALWVAPESSANLGLSGSNVTDVDNLGYWVGDFAQPTAGNRMTWDTGTFNRPALSCDPSVNPQCADWTGLPSVWAPWGNNSVDYDVYVQATRRISGSGESWILSQAGRAGPFNESGFEFRSRTSIEFPYYVINRNGGNWVFTSGTTGNDVDLRSHIWRCTYRTGTAGNRYTRIIMDGDLIMGEALGGTDPVPGNFAQVPCLGARNLTGLYTLPMNGWVHQVLGYERELSATEDANVVSYCNSRFGNSNSVLYVERFPADVGFSTFSIGAAGSYAVASNQLTITNPTGGFDLYVQKDAPQLPSLNALVFVTVVDQVTTGTFDNPGVGIGQDGSNLIIAEYRIGTAGTTGDLRVLSRIGGVSTFTNVALGVGVAARPYKLGLMLSEDSNFVRLFTDFDGAGLRYRGSVAPTATLSTLNLANWLPIVGFASNAAGAADSVTYADFTARYWT